MKNTTDIKMKAFYLIQKTITLKFNVFQGCPNSKAELTENLKRMPAVKAWFKKNDLTEDLKYFVAQCSPHYQATELGDLLF